VCSTHSNSVELLTIYLPNLPPDWAIKKLCSKLGLRSTRSVNTVDRVFGPVSGAKIAVVR
jgi:hypothetical protein